MEDRKTVDSSSDNTMRSKYRVLSDAEKRTMDAIKNEGDKLHRMISDLGASREISIAKTKLEEAVMWSVKHLTA